MREQCFSVRRRSNYKNKSLQIGLPTTHDRFTKDKGMTALQLDVIILIMILVEHLLYLLILSTRCLCFAPVVIIHCYHFIGTEGPKMLNTFFQIQTVTTEKQLLSLPTVPQCIALIYSSCQHILLCNNGAQQQ